MSDEKTNESGDKPTITITPLAAEKLRQVMKDDNKNPDTDALRIFVQGGGCSGFQYGLMLNEDDGAGDQKFESNGIKIVVDPISINYIKNATVDYDEIGGGFSIKNPQAKSTCGCGSSFSTE